MKFSAITMFENLKNTHIKKSRKEIERDNDQVIFKDKIKDLYQRNNIKNIDLIMIQKSYGSVSDIDIFSDSRKNKIVKLDHKGKIYYFFTDENLNIHHNNLSYAIFHSVNKSIELHFQYGKKHLIVEDNLTSRKYTERKMTQEYLFTASKTFLNNKNNKLDNTEIVHYNKETGDNIKFIKHSVFHLESTVKSLENTDSKFVQLDFSFNDKQQTVSIHFNKDNKKEKILEFYIRIETDNLILKEDLKEDNLRIIKKDNAHILYNDKNFFIKDIFEVINLNHDISLDEVFSLYQHTERLKKILNDEIHILSADDLDKHLLNINKKNINNKNKI